VKRPINRLTVGLSLGVAVVVVVAFAAGSFLYSAHFYNRMLETERKSAQAQAETIKVGLEHAMLADDRDTIGQMVAAYAHDPWIGSVIVVNREGKLAWSSLPRDEDAHISRDSPTCRACHVEPAERRARSRVIATRDGEMLRIVTPIENQPRCHGCHEPQQKMNGVLIVDVKAGQMRARLDKDLRGLALVSGLLALVAMAGVATTVRLVFLRRLRRFEAMAREIAAGDIVRRLPVEHDDLIGWLAREFNMLADAVTGLAADLKDQSEQLERVINAVDDGIVVLDRERRVIAANDAFLCRLGSRREALLGRVCGCTPGMCCDTATCAAELCFERGAHQTAVRQLVDEGGAARWEEVRSSAIRGPDGRVQYVVESWRDITERRNAEARAAEAHRLASVGMLASGFSHELNTPLGSILTCVEAIQRELRGHRPDFEYVEESARIAHDQLLRCRAITQHFLRLARGGAATATGELLELDAVVPRMAQLVQPTARELGVEVVVGTPGGAARATVFAPESDVQQVLLNLLMNAVQACARGGRVEIAVDVGPPIRVRVTDDGKGIAAAERAHLFEPFFSRRPGGTGLGLFISKKAAQGWGGDIVVESEPGRGSTFEVRFPARAPAAEPRASGGEAA
jgi:PAS domain S-box-containing protein